MRLRNRWWVEIESIRFEILWPLSLAEIAVLVVIAMTSPLIATFTAAAFVIGLLARWASGT